MCSRIRTGLKTIIVLGDLPVEREPVTAEPVTDVEWADFAHGIATWVGIHFGTGAGLKVRASAAFQALGQGKFGAFLSIVSFNKIDGNQGE
jgi:hypothetical protein